MHLIKKGINIYIQNDIIELNKILFYFTCLVSVTVMFAVVSHPPFDISTSVVAVGTTFSSTIHVSLDGGLLGPAEQDIVITFPTLPSVGPMMVILDGATGMKKRF